MDARELRIGNYVQGDFKKCIEVTNKIMNAKIELDNQWLKPIPITKEWLLKFGFVQQYWGVFLTTYYRKGNILYSLSDGNVELYKPNICLTQLKYVHQLQNLFFALTGEELTFKN
jgi:hypothetical protein